MPIVVLGLSHRTSSVDVRERFAFDEREIPRALDSLRARGLAEEAVILSTCNRVELYAVTNAALDAACGALQQFLCEMRSVSEAAAGTFYRLTEPQSLEHLFKVACGLDSMVLGETEILGQLKKAYDMALQGKHTGGRLNKAFQRAFHIAKQIRTETKIQRGSTSVAAVAVELAEKIFDTLEHRSVLVLGAGETSEKTVRALHSRGARSVVVSNRSLDRALALAEELGGRAIRFEDWPKECEFVDIVISSTAAPHYVVERQALAPRLPARQGRPLLLIDIAVPRDIDPELNLLEGVFLYNIDDLQGIADEYVRQRQMEVARCEMIIREKARGLLAGQGAALRGWEASAPGAA